MLCSLAAGVGDKEVEEIRALEEGLGYTLLAFACHDARPAPATETQLDQIRSLEKRLGVSLVAIDRRPAA